MTLYGTAALAGGTALSLLALLAGSAAAYLVAVIVVGTGFGTAFSGILRTIMPILPAHERAEVFAVIFVVSYLAGIIFASALNSIKLGGYPLGFWFAHQGSIYIFIALIFWYAKKIGDIDRKFGMQED